MQIADDANKGIQLSSEKTKELLGDALSLFGHAFFLLSVQRRQVIKSFLNERYAKICANDVPITSALFGDNCAAKLKELGDLNRFPLVKPFMRVGFSPRGGRFANSFYGGLNHRGSVQRRGGQGLRGSPQFLRGNSVNRLFPGAVGRRQRFPSMPRQAMGRFPRARYF